MVSVPEHVMKRINEEYPMIRVEWDNLDKKFVIMERYYEGCLARVRRIMDYENFDGTHLPLVGDRLTSLLHMADTKKNPLKPRVNEMRRDREMSQANKKKEFQDYVVSHLEDNAAYFTTANRFFMDPKSMPAWKSTYMPSQERVLRQWGKI